MAEPSTVNGGLIIPNTGDLPGTWASAALNPDFVALDGQLYGVQTISASNSAIVLTSPANFTPTPSGGPTQAQNAVLRFTGVLTANVQVTLPLPGFYIVENLTTGSFVLSFRALGSGDVIGIDQGEVQHIYNDGTNVKFVNLGRIGASEIWAGLSGMPAWVTACTVPPYLLCDGSVYSFSTYPYLGARLKGAFGGNGISTFGVPDLQGRVPLPYDGTGSRITPAGSGLNGQTIGAALDKQTNTLLTANLPPYTPSGTISGNTTTAGLNNLAIILGNGTTSAVGGGAVGAITTPAGVTTQIGVEGTLNGTAQGGTSTPVNNVQPSQVTGIAVIRAA